MTQIYDGYGIVNAANTDLNKAQQELIRIITPYLEKGWIPQGGISHIIAPTSPTSGLATHVFCQAIVLPVAQTEIAEMER